MPDWSADELAKIGEAIELEIAPRRNDGTTWAPVPIWVVRVGNDLYIRSVYGRTAGWFRHALLRHEGHIRAGGIDRDVRFDEVGREMDDALDAQYRSKYRSFAAEHVDTTVTDEAKGATLRLVPAETP
mgnify:CR=1 FL=1